MNQNKGFTLIEVLISTIILFFSIVTLHVAFKQYVNLREKQQKYERIYMTVLSIEDKLKNMDLKDNNIFYGELNKLKYKVTIEEITRARNFYYGPTPVSTGNRGMFQIVLYKITLSIANREYSFYETRYFKNTQ